MKAVIYHATVNFREFQPGSEDFPDDIYEQLFAGARKNLAYFNIPSGTFNNKRSSRLGR
jgi:hypothetical protein